MDTNYIKRVVALAMRAPDDFVIEIIYKDRRGRKTKRTVSPTRFIDQDKFAALCLCREEVRNFYFSKISHAVLRHSADVLMPVEIIEIPVGDDAPSKQSGRC